MKRLSLEPDAHMRWIYDYTHPDYNSDVARDLRERRRVAMQNAPKWMIEEARLNDSLTDIQQLQGASSSAASPRQPEGEK